MKEDDVTPFVGVWIETKEKRTFASLNVSHPSWVCGLKHLKLAEPMFRKVSHPSWVCGLKPQQIIDKS